MHMFSRPGSQRTASIFGIILTGAILLALGLGTFLAPALPTSAAKPSEPAAPAVSTSIVISQFQVAGATAGDEFIELHNVGNTSLDLNGYRVVYRSAAGTNDVAIVNWSTTTIIPAGAYYLIAGATGYTGTATPDITWANGGTGTLSGTSGGLAIRQGAANTGTIIDSVGYGAATNAFVETATTAAPAASTSQARKTTSGGGSAGCLDTDNNSTDFLNLNPSAPRNSATTPVPCGSVPTDTPTATATPLGPTNTPTDTPTGPVPTATPIPPSNTPTPVVSSARIHDIQGAAHLSPLRSTAVTNVPGIVTARTSSGFYMQDPSPDANDATSEGIFVFTSSAPTVAVGDSVLVSGTVNEFRPGGASGLTNLTTTEIGSPTVVLLSSGNALPTPVVIGTGGRVPPNTVIEDDASGDVETSGVFDPAQDGIDFYESMEGMRVQINNAVAVGPTNDFGEVPVVGDDGANAGPRTPRGGVIIQPTDFNPERITLDDVITNTPVLTVGDHLPLAVGVMDYNFGLFMVELTQQATVVPGNLPREVTTAAGTNQLSVSTFNVENLNPGDPPSKFAALATTIINNLRSPDLISVEEVQDNTGPTDNGVVDASTTWGLLINAITSAGGPTYIYRQIDPVNDQDGGQPGGNIRQGFLYRTDRGLAFIDRPGGCSTCANAVQPGPQLLYSPGRIDPSNTAWNSSRKPLAGEFTFNGHHLFAIANHFNSKGGDDPLTGHLQPPTRSSEVQRHQQAQIVHDFVNQILTQDANADIVVLGDLNDFYFSGTLDILTGGGTPILTDMITTLPVNERYTYDFEGNAQDLDHALMSAHLVNTASPLFDVVHVNSEYPTSVRTSDHDPAVTLLTFAPLSPTPTATFVPGQTPTDTPTPTLTSTATSTATATSTPVPLGPHLVISQVYGGGGNSGSVYTNDFIEIFNPTGSPITFTDWSVQYAAATGTTWQVSVLTGTHTLQPGQYFLVREANGAGGTQALPTPDSLGSIPMAAGAGKVALVNNSTALTCGANCHSAAGVQDFVGYGATANDFEGPGPAPVPGANVSDVRLNGGCTDTDNNTADFTTATPPTPRNSASPFNVCQVATPTVTSTPVGPTPTATVCSTVLNGHLTYQGLAQPNAGNAQAISLQVEPIGGGPLSTYNTTSDANGNFSANLGALAPGTYTWRLKSPRYLATTGTLTVSGSCATTQDFGTQPAGDINNDNCVDTTDFSLLRSSFNAICGDGNYNAAADYNNDCLVDITDFSLLRSNFGQCGAPALTGPARARP